MRIRDITEARYQGVPLIYHTAPFPSAIDILRQGVIQPWTETEIDGKLYKGVSLTRSFWFASVFNDVVFGLDLTKIRNQFRGRMLPYADPGLGDIGEDEDGETRGDYRREAEEFVIAPIPISGNLVAIWISSDHIDPRIVASDSKFAPYLEEIEKHPLYKGWTKRWPLPRR